MNDKLKDDRAARRPDPEPPSDDSRKYFQKSAGDKLFDLGVYGGLGYLANAAISLALTRHATHLPGSRLHKIGVESERQFARLLKGINKDAESLDYWAKKSNEILFLGSGGWVLLLPMTWLENHKPAIVQAIDKQLGTGPQTPEGKKLQQTVLSEGPRQSYLSLFAGRVVSYAATIAFALPFVTKWTKTNEKFSLFLNEQLGHQIGELRQPMVMIGETQVPAFISSLSSETILAGTAAALHYGSSKLFAQAGHTLRHRPAAGFTIERSADGNPDKQDAPGNQIRQVFREAVVDSREHEESPSLGS